MITPIASGYDSFMLDVLEAFGIEVKNYTTLDEHPYLIECDGWYNTKTGVVHIANREDQVAVSDSLHF
jgi:hypothetical protein